MANGSDALPLPFSLSRWLRDYGPMAAISAWLVWQLTQGFGAQLGKISDKLDAHETAAASSRLLVEDQRRLLETLVLINRAACVNAAKDEASRLRCVQQ